MMKLQLGERDVLSIGEWLSPYFIVCNAEDPLAFKAIIISPFDTRSARTMETIEAIWLKSEKIYKTRNKQSKVQKKDGSSALNKRGKKPAGSRRQA